MLSPNVRSVGKEAFCSCRYMNIADFRAAHGLRVLKEGTFDGCVFLEQVLLNDGLRTIRTECFNYVRLETFTAPPSLCRIEKSAFLQCSYLKHLDLSACLLQDEQRDYAHTFLVEGATGYCSLDDITLPRTLRVIGEGMFRLCRVKKVIFSPDSLLEEIETAAFWGSRLESFVAPPSLRKIGPVAFGNCEDLRDFTLNDGIQEVGDLFLWKANVYYLRLPPQIKKTPKQLGVSSRFDPELRLPDGLETVGDGWFANGNIERLVVPNSVRRLGKHAFKECFRLREVVFEPDSQLRSIGSECFYGCRFKKVVIPRRVRSIGKKAFFCC